MIANFRLFKCERKFFYIGLGFFEGLMGRFWFLIGVLNGLTKTVIPPFVTLRPSFVFHAFLIVLIVDTHPIKHSFFEGLTALDGNPIINGNRQIQ